MTTGDRGNKWPAMWRDGRRALPGPGDAARRSSPYVIYIQTEGLMPQSPVHCQPSDTNLDHPSRPSLHLHPRLAGTLTKCHPHCHLFRNIPVTTISMETPQNLDPTGLY